VEFTKDDVLNRPELDIAGVDPKHFQYEGTYPENQFWHGEDCYLPVVYKAQRYRLKVKVKSCGR